MGVTSVALKQYFFFRLDVYFHRFIGVGRVVKCKSIHRETVRRVTLFTATSGTIEFVFYINVERYERLVGLDVEGTVLHLF